MPLVDRESYAWSSGGVNGYFFTTPSGLWRCAILSDSAQGGADDRMAGCQPKTSVPLDVAGAPDVPDHFTSNPVRPNAILVNTTDAARFASLSQALFWRFDESTPVLPYGQALSASGFTCNVQTTGVSCRSDASGKGFQFSTGGFDFNYAEAKPVGASTGSDAVPSAPAAAPSAVQPVLGRIWGPAQEGYGQVLPQLIFDGGGPTGAVRDLVWQSWGGDQAMATGTAIDATMPGVGSDRLAPANVVAYDLGDCDGTFMYKSVVWFFPKNGETFESARPRGIHPCDERPYGVSPTSDTSSAASCGMVTAADGIERQVFTKGPVSCADGMPLVQATYPALYDKPMDGKQIGQWDCGVVPAGARIFLCNNHDAGAQVFMYR
ncbi:hypothetical protein [Antrihabitans cavernicola]|uniref:Uncharacterized protein n=1 Tax=Antrihabitans cavernicola TaxID=2495913 RepID=A0A5A7S8K7_9NOCA|nr:hypothetical protein [Spelaeibacter cavernicola]KAA0020214.1 hypothetical protein FOY51_21790 [Spelaeibacter cavernicola]